MKPNARNLRKHSATQIHAIARSLDAFGFNAPILIDGSSKIIAGYGRYEAAKWLGLTEVPVIYLEHLSEAQAKAYLLADNKLTDRSSWNDPELAQQLKELKELAIDFDIEDTGSNFQRSIFELDLWKLRLARPMSSSRAPGSQFRVPVTSGIWVVIGSTVGVR